MNNPHEFQPGNHKQLRNFPKEKKNTPKSHSRSQAKTSELPPSAEYHLVVNYSSSELLN